MSPMDGEARVYVAGHRGLVGSAIVRRLRREGVQNLILANREEVDLTRREEVEDLFERRPPDYVFVAAARVGGILANDTYPGDFIRENLAIELNVLDAARRHGVRKLLFIGSSCIYPRDAAQPIREESLLTGPLEPTNRAYAVAKIAGVEMCRAYRRQYGSDFIAAMPTNLYGPGDNFDEATSHVLPALIRRFHEAKLSKAPRVVVWGSGKPRRELMHVDDLADACLFLMRRWSSMDPINIGVGKDIAIRELAELVRSVVGYNGRVEFDLSKPDGTPRKLLDTSRLTALGWRPAIGLQEGIAETYRWYFAQQAGHLPPETTPI